MDSSIAIIAAIITGIFAFAVGKLSSKDQYVTQQRQDWRSYLRNWIEEFTILVKTSEKMSWNTKSLSIENEKTYYKETINIKIESMINALIVRLNPERDDRLIHYLMEALEKAKFDTDLITFYLSRYLKQDWENVKTATSILGDTPKLNLIFTIALFICGVFTVQAVGERYFNFDILRLFLSILLGYIFLRLLYTFTMNNASYRRILSGDVFRSKVRCFVININAPKKVYDLFLSILYVVFMIFLINNWKNLNEYPLNFRTSIYIYIISYIIVFIIFYVFMYCYSIRKCNSSSFQHIGGEYKDDKKYRYGFKKYYCKTPESNNK